MDENRLLPANDNLFSSGTLGRYSRALKSVMESHVNLPKSRQTERDFVICNFVICNLQFSNLVIEPTLVLLKKRCKQK